MKSIAQTSFGEMICGRGDSAAHLSFAGDNRSLVVRVLILMQDEGALYLMMLYFIGSAIGLIFVLINLNKKIKAADKF